jgi:hypothetical protein
VKVTHKKYWAIIFIMNSNDYLPLLHPTSFALDSGC